MVQTILSALAPIVFTLLLGFVAAWRRDFGPKEASVLNRMVLLYAVPLALFVGTVGTPRADLVQDIALVVAIFAAIVGLYALVFLVFRFIFRFPLSESVLAALTASGPPPIPGPPCHSATVSGPVPSGPQEPSYLTGGYSAGIALVPPCPRGAPPRQKYKQFNKLTPGEIVCVGGVVRAAAITPA